MRLDRRTALGVIGAAATAPAAAQGAPGARASEPPTEFAFGVASGDPLAERVILWTACRTPGPVSWEVARDPRFGRIVRRGGAFADPARDRTVKIDVDGLQPGTRYYYRFRRGADVSPVGRTRTLPRGRVSEVVLAVANCSLLPNGYFNAYAAIAELPRVDAVIHLGDYIYEYGGPGTYGMDSPVADTRRPEPFHDCVTLQDYRTRLAQYRRDLQLQAAHACAPWIVVWDDHETANDSWRGGAQNHRADEGSWDARKAAAIKAYYEWMPIREPKDHGFAIWRSFDFGDLASLFMLETRLTARDRQLTYAADLPQPVTPEGLAAFRARLADPARRMMSPGQEAWLEAGLARSVAAGRPWQVIGNQVLMANVVFPPVRAIAGEAALARALAGADAYTRASMRISETASANGLPYLLDSWDGYPADRQRLYDVLRRTRAGAVVLSGDSHAFWANALEDGAAPGRLAAVEFGATAISSPGADDHLPGLQLGPMFAAHNRQVRFADQGAKGFLRLTLTRDAAVGEMMAVSTIHDTAFETRVLKRFRVTRGPDGVSGPTEV